MLAELECARSARAGWVRSAVVRRAGGPGRTRPPRSRRSIQFASSHQVAPASAQRLTSSTAASPGSVLPSIDHVVAVHAQAMIRPLRAQPGDALGQLLVASGRAGPAWSPRTLGSHPSQRAERRIDRGAAQQPDHPGRNPRLLDATAAAPSSRVGARGSAFPVLERLPRGTSGPTSPAPRRASRPGPCGPGRPRTSRTVARRCTSPTERMTRPPD